MRKIVVALVAALVMLLHPALVGEEGSIPRLHGQMEASE